MTSLLEQVGDYLLRWTAWLTVMGSIAAIVALAVRSLLRSRTSMRLIIGAGIAGAIVVASLADRFGVAGPRFDVLRLPLPWLTVVLGAVTGTVALIGVQRRRSAPLGD